MNCAILSCGHDAVEIVSHPQRPDSPVGLCDYHAGNVHHAPNLDSEVIADV